MGWRRFCQSVSGCSASLHGRFSRRELALYGFRCVASDAFGRPVTFAVEHFERGKFHSLARVRRKANYGRSRRM